MSSLRAFTVSIALASENTVGEALCPRGFGVLNVDIAMPQPCMIVYTPVKSFEHDIMVGGEFRWYLSMHQNFATTQHMPN